MSLSHRVLMFGLDCAAPALLFERFRRRTPTLSALMARGIHGPLRTVAPPITVPAWMCMFTGRDPGELGVYGFRNRASYAYDDLVFASSESVSAPAIWDAVGAGGGRSLVVGVPLTYPVRPIDGVMVGDFMAPTRDTRFVHPPRYLPRLDSLAGGEYVADVEEFRSDDHERLRAEIPAMTRARFRLFRELLRREPWDFAVLHEIGLDRIQHTFWQFFDTGHRLYHPGNPYERVVEDFYALLDEEIAATLDMVDERVTVVVTSDHGARRLLGGVCVNEALIRAGLLTLRRYPDAPERLTPDMIDWDRTVAWGEGGYYARVFLNVAGREPRGVIPHDDYHEVRERVATLLQDILGPAGEPLGTVVYRPEDVYRACNGVAPDLMVFFGNLDYRSVGTVGWRSLHTAGNDTGPDGANHDWDGVIVAAGPAITERGRLDALHVLDVAPALHAWLGLTPTAHFPAPSSKFRIAFAGTPAHGAGPGAARLPLAS